MNRGESSVAIVVPTYKQALTSDERCALEQLQRVLGRYPRFFVAPESLQPQYGRLSQGFGVVRFPDGYFRDIAAYSRLLLSEAFYAAFARYEYILIYQLDAFVFADRLLEFCAKGYDYIGAPIRYGASLWHFAGARVGNGGLSLRRVASCQRLARAFAQGAMPQPLWEVLAENEDTCFGWAASQTELDFHVPSVKEALDFAVQENVQHVYRRIASGWRPFGCHGWDRFADAMWRPLVASALGHPVRSPLLQRGILAINASERNLRDWWRAHAYLPVTYLYGLVRAGHLSAAAACMQRHILQCGFAPMEYSFLRRNLSDLYRHAACWPRGREARAALLTALLVALRQMLYTTHGKTIDEREMQRFLDLAEREQAGEPALLQLWQVYRQLRERRGSLIPVEPSLQADAEVSRRLRVYVVMHRLVPAPVDPAYAPILVGPKACVAPPTLLTDRRGDNIARRNPFYCELTALYWAWKNDDLPDYVGMCHYRRYLYLPGTEGFRGVLTGEHILSLMQDCDILLPEAVPLSTNLATQFCEHHGKRPLFALEKVMQQYAPESLDAFYRVMAGNKAYFYNIFVMRREAFAAYMTWLFPLLFATEQEMGGFTADGRDRYQQRLGGFLAERLLNVYVVSRHMRIREAALLDV